MSLAAEMAGEAAAAEILVIRAAPVRCVRTGLDVLVFHLPEGLHHIIACLVPARAAAVQCCRARVDEVDESVLCHSLRPPACHTLAGLGAPIGTHVMEAGRGVGDQRAQQHGHTVAGVVLRCKGRGHFRAVPVESAGQDGLGKIRVGQPVCPLALPLEAACHRVAAQRFLVPAQLVQLRVAVQDVPHHHRHLGDKLPVLVRGHDLGPGNDLRQVFARVAVKALAAIGLYPGQRPFVFLRIVNTQRDAAHDLRHVHPFGAHPEIFLEQLRVAEAARNAHCDTAQVHIGKSEAKRS